MRKIRKSLMEIEEKDTKTVCSEMVRPFFIALKKSPKMEGGRCFRTGAYEKEKY